MEILFPELGTTDSYFASQGFTLSEALTKSYSFTDIYKESLMLQK